MGKKYRGLTQKALDKIQQLRDSGWKDADIARRAGITKGALSKWINGESLNPQLSSAQGLARALGISSDEVFESEDDSEEASLISLSFGHVYQPLHTG